MSALAPISPKLARLIPRLASEHDGEVVATVRAIARTLKAAGQDFHDLANAIEHEPEVAVIYLDPETDEPSTWHELARWCRDHDDGRLAAKERRFVKDMVARLICDGRPSEKQAAWLRAIYATLQKGCAR